MEKQILEINYNNKVFTTVSNTKNGEVSEQTIFNYHQENSIVWAEYWGGDILKGFLIGKVLDDFSLEFSYQHLNKSMEIRVGTCTSKPEKTQDGKIRLYETWQWLNGDKSKDKSKGKSVIEEAFK